MIQTIKPLSGCQYLDSFQVAAGKLLSICPVPVKPFEKEEEHSGNISKTETDLCKIDGLRDICLHNLGYPRKRMPQLNAKVLAAYVKKKIADGILVERTSYYPSELVPVQREINRNFVEDLILSTIAGTYDACRDPILVADDPVRVVDGHHRWAACLRLWRPIDAIHVHDKVQKVLLELRDFAGVDSYAIEK